MYRVATVTRAAPAAATADPTRPASVQRMP